MITPIFKLSQDDANVYMTIKAPHARVTDTEIDIESDSHVKFYSNPYFLRIKLPQQVVADGKECAKYDCDSGTFTVTIPKLKYGEKFEDLDMITSLIAVPKVRRKANLIEEIDVNGSANDEEDGEEETIEWTYEESNVDVTSDYSVASSTYGFANSKSNVFNSMGDEIALAIDCQHVDSKASHVRRSERIEDELQKFDEEYYLSCLYEEQELVERLLDFRPYWYTPSQVEMNEQDLYDLKNMSSRSFILDRKAKKQLLLSLVDILCAYAYEIRVNEGETSPESQWTVCKLSATLSWLEGNFESVKDVLLSFTRRSLVFPLHRNFRLSRKVIEDVTMIMKQGKKCILKCLLDIRRILNSGCDSRYILNDLYINHYCVWIQKVKDTTVSKLADCLEETSVQITKDDVGLDLIVLERAAELTLEEQGVHDVVDATSALTLNAGD